MRLTDWSKDGRKLRHFPEISVFTTKTRLHVDWKHCMKRFRAKDPSAIFRISEKSFMPRNSTSSIYLMVSLKLNFVFNRGWQWASWTIIAHELAKVNSMAEPNSLCIVHQRCTEEFISHWRQMKSCVQL